jgi:hypothetical protein
MDIGEYRRREFPGMRGAHGLAIATGHTALRMQASAVVQDDVVRTDVESVRPERGRRKTAT